MLMHEIAMGICANTFREFALKVDYGRKIPCRTRESNRHQCCARLFSPAFCELSCLAPPPFLVGGRGGGGGGLSIKSEGGSGQDPFDQKLGWILYWHGLIHNEVSRKIRSKVHLLVFFANNKMTKQPQAPVKAHKPYAYQYCWVQLCFSTSKYYNKVPSHIVLWARVKKSADLRFVKTKDHSSNRAGNRVSLPIFHDVAQQEWPHANTEPKLASNFMTWYDLPHE